MSLAYRILYGIGVTPWERMEKLPIADQGAGFFVREEQGREAPYGPVLDLGCGSGIWAVKLAQRGWDVTGVDFIPKALRRARERAREAGVEARFVQGDVTKLGEAGVGAGFPFLFDFGLFHDELTDEQREAMGREVTAVAAPDAILLMTAMSPGRRGPLPRGAGRGDIEAAYPEWKVIDEVPADVSGAPRWIRRANLRFYRLRRE